MKVKLLVLALVLALSAAGCAKQTPSPPTAVPAQFAVESVQDTQIPQVAEVPNSMEEIPLEQPTPPQEKESTLPEAQGVATSFSVRKETPEQAKEPKVEIASTGVPLGETMVIYISNSGAEKVSATTTLPFTPHFFPIENEKLMAFLPVACNTTVGAYTLDIKVGEKNFHYDVNVEEKKFEVQYLTVDATVTANTAGSNDANREWEVKVNPLKYISREAKYWDGAFLQPVQGPITTQFGMTRYTNGSSVPSIHQGIDIAAKQGTQVAATNAGEILFAEYIQLTGNTVVLEHGMGLKSFYYHMDSLDVKAGDMVEKGAPIGKVGSTGFSTGPHLHYALLVNDVFINPWTAFDNGIG